MAPFNERLRIEHDRLVHEDDTAKWDEYNRLVTGVDAGFFPEEHRVERKILRPNEVEFLIENGHTDVLNAAKEKGMLPQDIDE